MDTAGARAQADDDLGGIHSSSPRAPPDAGRAHVLQFVSIFWP
jgi:hypothetical protein